MPPRLRSQAQLKVILINTAKDLLTHDGAAIFGRFFIALIAQAALQRSALAPHERVPAFVYVDEAQDYFDDKIGHLLNQARKYRVGMVLAHQNLDQLAPSLRASVMTSASIKLAGGVSAKDARALCEDMHCEPDFIQSMRKRKDRTEFACFVRNFTPHAVQVSVPLGYVESLPQVAEEDRQQLIEGNRRLYCASVDEVNRLLTAPSKDLNNDAAESTARTTVVSDHPKREPGTVVAKVRDRAVVNANPQPQRTDKTVVPDAPVRVPTSSGRGGMQHKYLQQVVKRLAEARGFRALIEEEVLEGGGRVDVALIREDLRIACEVTVTSGSDQELRNIEKCLAAGYERVILLADDPKHLNAIKKAIARNIDSEKLERVFFGLAEDVPVFLDNLPQGTIEADSIRGYKVRVKRTPSDAGETKARRRAVADVLARSIKRLRDNEA